MKRRRRINWPFLGSIVAACALIVVYISVQTLLGVASHSGHSHSRNWQLALVASLMDATIAVWFFAVGASIGSFLNVVAYRLPIGRGVGGHSSCPFCRTPIAGTDNIPVFAWIRLRGRCRSCRLPISAQYPLVEFAVGVLFLIVYLTEFRSSGSNLPDDNFARVGFSGMLGFAVTLQTAARLGTYLFALSGLVAAALIAVKRKTVPLKLYVWCALPTFLAAIAMPETVVVRWREALPTGPTEARLDGLTTVLCGIVAGIALARLVAPIVYTGFDRSFIASDRQTNGARQFVGAMGLTGAVVGWQAMIPLSWILAVLATVAVWILRRWTQCRAARLGDLTVWVWLGLLAFRAGWEPLSHYIVFDSGILRVLNVLLPALAFALLARFFVSVAPNLESDHSGNAFTEEDEDDTGDWDVSANLARLQKSRRRTSGRTSNPSPHRPGSSFARPVSPRSAIRRKSRSANSVPSAKMRRRSRNRGPRFTRRNKRLG